MLDIGHNKAVFVLLIIDDNQTGLAKFRFASPKQGGLQQWAKEFSEQSGDACPAFVARRLTMLLDVGEPNQRHRMLQLLFLRHMVVFHHSPNLLKGTPGQLSAKLDIPEVVLRHFLEVLYCIPTERVEFCRFLFFCFWFCCMIVH